MCFAVFIATSQPQQTAEFVPNATTFYLRELKEEEFAGLCDKFSEPYIYYVGSGSQCSCDFNFHPEYFDDPEWADNKVSAQALIDLIMKLAEAGPAEYYCCWEGDWEEPIEESSTVNINDVTLDKNYWGLTEREFIRFMKD